MIVSAVQFCPRLAMSAADVGDNLRKCEDLFHQTWKVGSELVVFPELSFTGYTFLSGEEAVRVCEKFDGPTFRFMQSVALHMKSYVAWGYVESDGSYLYNSGTLVGPDGKLLTRYRKINFFSCDFIWATPGKIAAPIVETDFGSMSMVICRDLRDKIPNNIPRVASDGKSLWNGGKVDIVAACTNWGRSGGYPPTTFMDFVADNHCTLVVADRWGKEENTSHGDFVSDFGSGKSVIISPDWKVHTDGMIHGTDCVVTAVIDRG